MSFKKGKYQHYKGNYYEVLDIVTHSETEERLVLYKPLYEKSEAVNNKDASHNSSSNLWVRPYDMFFEQIETMGKTMPRFAFVGQP